MIVKMSKIELIGKRDLIEPVIELLQGAGIFHIEHDVISLTGKEPIPDMRSFVPDERTMVERFFLEDLRSQINELIPLLPSLKVRKSYLQPLAVIDLIAKSIDKHLTIQHDLSERKEGLIKERTEMDRNRLFFSALAEMLEKAEELPDIDIIGLTIQEPGAAERLREAISRITDWRFELVTENAEDGSLVGLITVEKDMADPVKKVLSDEQVPELHFPPSFEKLSFSEKMAWVNDRMADIDKEIKEIDLEKELFTRRWVPIYKRVLEWIDERLSVIGATTHAWETRLCFFINGWIPSKDLHTIREKLSRSFGEDVVLEEKEIVEEDLDRVPILLQNRPYFKPYELFTRILPLPTYTSYDPTPFIGIFFPVFFGMILGDAGYAVVLFVLSLLIGRKYRQNRFLHDLSRIMIVCSGYTFLFGIIYGEFFGDLLQRLFNVGHFGIERRTAILPMFAFAISIGAAHILLGFFLGALSALRKHTRREALYNVLSILTIIGLLILLASLFGYFPELLTRPVIIAILIITPFLVLTGGFLAPLEFLKSIGNIISYVRIMAIGLTSVLLAFVANNIAGLAGNIVLGVVLAGLLHLLNIILGVFSPTIHSLRLHYVEFFSKFIEHGGKGYRPLGKSH